MSPTNPTRTSLLHLLLGGLLALLLGGLLSGCSLLDWEGLPRDDSPPMMMSGTDAGPGPGTDAGAELDAGTDAGL
jgi:hypothetical protein